jgi:transcriptional regulator GlxA family with amidase domain
MPHHGSDGASRNGGGERTRLVAMLAFPGAQVLDVTGPLEVFARASRWMRDHGVRRTEAYAILLLAEKAGPVAMSSGLRLVADRAFSKAGGIDTLLVAGGVGTWDQLKHRALLDWLRRQSKSVRRLCSVCTGSFLLAEAGLLKRRRATTHWGWIGQFARRHPGVRLEPDRIFVRDGNVYTSAGVTAGMDLALALVEEDHGRDVALEVARELVLFLRRPGGQSQFSAQLAAQLAEKEPLREIQARVLEHPGENHAVPALAQRLSMSTRNFSRAFRREVGVTPARWVEAARIEAARRLLEESRLGVKEIASRCGLGSAESLRRAFLRVVGVSPSDYRERFAAPPRRTTNVRKRPS